MYKISSTNTIIRVSDGANIPLDIYNSDYQAYLSWVALGNTPDPVSAPTAAQMVQTITDAIQLALDKKAQERGYTGINSACAYASTTAIVSPSDPHFSVCEGFRSEGNALQLWMTVTWATAFAYLATVNSGANPMPTTAQAVAMMSPFTWPN